MGGGRGLVIGTSLKTNEVILAKLFVSILDPVLTPKTTEHFSNNLSGSSWQMNFVLEHILGSTLLVTGRELAWSSWVSRGSSYSGNEAGNTGLAIQPDDL